MASFRFRTPKSAPNFHVVLTAQATLNPPPQTRNRLSLRDTSVETFNYCPCCEHAATVNMDFSDSL